MEKLDGEVILMPNVNSVILRKVITWADHHEDDTDPAEDDKNKKKRMKDISSWNADFLKVDKETFKVDVGNKKL